MEWISVKDRLPENEYEKRYLAYGTPICGNHDPKPVIEFCAYSDNEFIFGEYSCGLDASHWMELPEPPKE